MKKVHGLLISLLIGSSVLSACSKTADPTAPDGKGLQPSANQPATLVFYSTSADPVEGFNARFGDVLRKKFPNYTIQYIQNTLDNRLDKLIAAGQTIDIYMDSIGGFSSNVLNYGLGFDMTELIKKHGLDLNRFEPVNIDAVKSFSNGGLYGIPVQTSNLVLFYNKDIFDKFGVKYPKDGMTWDQVNELAKNFNRVEGGTTYFGLSMSPRHLLRLNNLSEGFVDPATNKATIDTENWKKILDAYFMTPGLDPVMKQSIKDTKRPPYVNQFFKDKITAMFNFLSSQPIVQPDLFKDLNWDMVSFPTFKDQPGVGTQSYPTYFGITAQSKEKDAAMEVIKYLTSDEYQMEYSKKGIMTVLKNKAIQDAYGTESQYKDKNLKAAFYNKFAPISKKTKYDESIIATIDNKLPSLMTGDVDLNTFVRDVQELAQKQIDSMK